MDDNNFVDAVVVGGGAAGLSGAVALARSRRTVLVVDAGEPRNAPAAAVHNYLGREGAPPAELLADGRAELASYGGQVSAGRVVAARPWDREGTGFVVSLDDGREVTARRLLVTTGLVDELPDVPGLRGRWGRDVLHCPYCHGWEVRDRAIGILWRGPMSLHQALLFRQLSDDVVMLLDGAAGPDADAAARLAVLGVPVVPGAVAEVLVEDDRLAGVRLVDGEVVAREALVVAPVFTARSAVLESLGVEAVGQAMGETVMGTCVPADPTGLTSVPGVWVAGNVTDLSAQVVVAAAGGMRAGAMINADLAEEDARVAVAHRSGLLAMFEQETWEERYAERPRIWSGNPNPQLVAEATGLAPGRALDIGSGEGADVIWLAGRGWSVTGLDFSRVALDRAAEHAAAVGADVAARTSWRQADLRGWSPAGTADEAAYDLVTSHFFHLPDRGMHDLVPVLATAVAPGGTLLVVGHHPGDLATGHRWGAVDMMYTAADLVPLLDPAEWHVEVAEDRAREVPAPAGEHEGDHGSRHEGDHGGDREGQGRRGVVTVRDAVLRARRR